MKVDKIVQTLGEEDMSDVRKTRRVLDHTESKKARVEIGQKTLKWKRTVMCSYLYER